MKIKIIKKVLGDLGKTKMEDVDWLPKSKVAMIEFIKNNPVRNNISARQSINGGKFLQLTFKPMPIVIGAIIVALLAGGGGTVYASQSSLPGDALYPVKLMTEDVQTTVAWNPEKKVEMETKFANRRLEEVQKLQKRLKNKDGEIKPEVVEKAMERAAERLDKAEARIAEMEEGVLKDKALTAASHLEEALQNHEQILSDLAGEVPDRAEQALIGAQAKAALHAERALGTIMRLEKNKEVGEKIKERIREGMPKIMGAEERAEGKLNALENKIEAARNYLENLKEQGRDMGNYEVKLGEAKNKLEEAKQLLEEKKFLEAFQTAGEVMKLIIQAKVEMRPMMPRVLPVERESDETSTPELNESSDQNESSSQSESEVEEERESDDAEESVRGTIIPLPAVQ
jgi:hypothetical protein